MPRLPHEQADASPLFPPLRRLAHRYVPHLSAPLLAAQRSSARYPIASLSLARAQTIIECLMMGTTGNLPPNCKNGQSFVNDPNIHGTSEVCIAPSRALSARTRALCRRCRSRIAQPRPVLLGVDAALNEATRLPPSSSALQVKAQIKLRFVGANKKHAVVNRSFSLTQKPSKREYKAFEAALRTVGADNVQTCVSFKCADLNKLVPEMMGVSTAVLESVVFVHQEDSCWPLAEDKVLKQKFDDIFAATEYTKALDALKGYKNEKAKEIRVLGAELETLETKLTTSVRWSRSLDLWVTARLASHASC